MIAVVNGRVFNTEISEALYTMQARRWDGSERTLYLSPNGTFFYVYTYPNHNPIVEVLGEGFHGFDGSTERVLDRDYDETDLAIKWLEFHGGYEAILERWPERLQPG